jgi:hypothetical protein
MPAKRATRQNLSAEELEALGAVGGAPPAPPPPPPVHIPPGGVPRSPAQQRRAGAIPRTPPAAAGIGPEEGFIPPAPAPVLIIHRQRVDMNENVNPPPPNYVEILNQPEAAAIPHVNAMGAEELRALIALQRQVLEELQATRRDRGIERRIDLERHDRLVEVMRQHNQRQNPGNQNYPGNIEIRPANILPPAHDFGHRQVPPPGPPGIRVGNQPVPNNAARVDEPPPAYEAVYQQGQQLPVRAPNQNQGLYPNPAPQQGPAFHAAHGNVPVVPIPGNNANHQGLNDNDAGIPFMVMQEGMQNGDRNSMHHLKAIELPRYSGAEEKKTPFDFIVELEKYKTISRSSEQFMLEKILPATLEGIAYNWYRHEMSTGPFVNWEDFKVRFRREFQALGYREHLYRELDRRTQGPSESLSVFIRVILDYYERLDQRPPEREIVSRIMRQMHPEYLTVLYGKEINTIRELKEAAFQAQDLIKHTRLYQPPPTYHSLEPSLAWQPVEARPAPPPVPILHPTENRSNPRVHFAAVDPFAFYHPPSTSRNVTFDAGQVNSRGMEQRSMGTRTSGPTDRPASPVQEDRNRPVSPLPPRDNRERIRSGSPDRGPLRCWECNGDHMRNVCPRLNRSPPASGNGRAPSPVPRQ